MGKKKKLDTSNSVLEKATDSKIVIKHKGVLSKRQTEDLFIIVDLMVKTGKPLKALIEQAWRGENA